MNKANPPFPDKQWSNLCSRIRNQFEKDKKILPEQEFLNNIWGLGTE
jgi:hypothetical protein